MVVQKLVLHVKFKEIPLFLDGTICIPQYSDNYCCDVTSGKFV